MSNGAIVIVGGGTMGEVVLRGCLQFSSAQSITVYDHGEERATALREMYGVTVETSGAKDVSEAMVVILAVKPQDAAVVAQGLTHPLENQLLVSVMAGVSTEQLTEMFGVKRAVRTMPNTPAKIGKGITAWTRTAEVNEEDSKFVKQLLETFGTHIEVESDDMIDRATAVSGSGPAYVYTFIEHLMTAAQELGFSEDVATQLVLDTVQGSIELLNTENTSVSELRQNVTSKGGTTEAALASLKNDDMVKLWMNALQAAYNRAKELNTK